MTRLGKIRIAWDALPAILQIARPVIVRSVVIDPEKLTITIVLEGDRFPETQGGEIPPLFSLEEILEKAP